MRRYLPLLPLALLATVRCGASAGVAPTNAPTADDAGATLDAGAPAISDDSGAGGAWVGPGDAATNLAEACGIGFVGDSGSAVGGSIDVIAFSDDLGTQAGPLLSLAMYREFFQPRHARLWRRAKQLAEVKVMLHCCGGVRPLLPALIEAGLDAINPVQVSCVGMDARSLKADFGDKLTFWGGGCDTFGMLPHATPEEIARHVRAQVAILNPGGGFVFQPVHNILADMPPRNVIAMFDAAKGEGRD